MDVIYYGVDAKWHQASLQGSARSGYSRLVHADGTVVSMQPGGGYGLPMANGTRPPGTDGPWEQGMPDGGFLVYTTDDGHGGTASYPVPVLKR